ncbi:hypothetical protein [Saccharothrix sp. HUAS TT1]|uniref:hypothetical protein n=1 Tax=unclassified Saccharothrix TaxID=2593673 RepID=UPI00345B5495
MGLTALAERVLTQLLPPRTPFEPLDPAAYQEWDPPPLADAAVVPAADQHAPLALTAATRPARPPLLPLSQQAPLQTEWSTRAWAYYRSSGEARQSVDWVAGGISRFHLYIGEATTDGSGDPEPLADPGVAGEVLAELFDGPLGQQEILRKLAIGLLVPGEVWLVGYPKPADAFDDPEADGPRSLLDDRLPDRQRYADWDRLTDPGALPDGGDPRGVFDIDEGTRTGDTAWTAVSRKEWQEMESGRLRVKLPEDPRRSADHWVDFGPDEVVLIPVYHPDPEDCSRATSAFEAALSIFEELDGLNRRVGADINSRLAGAGVAVVSENATMPNPGPAQGGGANPLNAHPFFTALMTAISTAIANPDAASAVAPITLMVPDEAFQGAGPIKHITFSTPFDAQVPVLRADARKRVAVVMDIPAAIVNGIEDLNHWSSWSISDDAVRSHLGPLASLICSALTRRILWPALRAAGETDWRSKVIWWDPSELVLRPDRSTEALAAHGARVISDKTLRRVLTFDEEDAPSEEELARRAAQDAAAKGGQAARAGGVEPEGGQRTPGDRPEAPSREESDRRLARQDAAGPPRQPAARVPG